MKGSTHPILRDAVYLFSLGGISTSGDKLARDEPERYAGRRMHVETDVSVESKLSFSRGEYVQEN